MFQQRKLLVHIGYSLIIVCSFLYENTFAFHPIKPQWTLIKKHIADHYPNLGQMTTDKLYELLAGPEKDKPLLIDARTSEEFEVSHISSAKHASNIKDALKRLKNVDNNQTIVIYCSVWIRSSKLANELQNAGYHNVYNLEGSIFKWVNEGYPVYHDSQRVYRVHPYDRKWRVLLNNDLWPLPFE